MKASERAVPVASGAEPAPVSMTISRSARPVAAGDARGSDTREEWISPYDGFFPLGRSGDRAVGKPRRRPRGGVTDGTLDGGPQGTAGPRRRGSPPSPPPGRRGVRTGSAGGGGALSRP